MHEIFDVRQIPGELVRRWFTSEETDLIVWLDAASAPHGFLFCYDKGRAERAVSWHAGAGLNHMQVDDGESARHRRHKSSPVLVPATVAATAGDTSKLKAIFLSAAQNLPADITDFVASKIDSAAV